MKKPKSEKKPSMDSLKELGQKYGVKVTDMSERGVRAIGFLGGVKWRGMSEVNRHPNGPDRR